MSAHLGNVGYEVFTLSSAWHVYRRTNQLRSGLQLLLCMPKSLSNKFGQDGDFLVMLLEYIERLMPEQFSINRSVGSGCLIDAVGVISNPNIVLPRGPFGLARKCQFIPSEYKP